MFGPLRFDRRINFAYLSLWHNKEFEIALQVTSDYLEQLRRLKTRLTRLKTRVETVSNEAFFEFQIMPKI